MLDVKGRRAAARLIEPIAGFVARLGVPASAITLAGLALTIAGSVVLGTGRLITGGWVILVGSALDALDGAVARSRGPTSERGAVLDSLSDRVGETAMWAGLAYHLAGDPVAVVLCVTALGASFSISYLRSKAEAAGVRGRSGLMARPERVILFVAGLVSGLVRPMLWAMVALTLVTVGQRLASLWGRLSR